MSWLADLLRDPAVKNMNVDGEERFQAHSRLLAQKPMLQEVFTDFHHSFDRLDKQYLSGNGIRVEIGAGVAPIRDSYQDVLATDIVSGPGLDRTLDAEAMDLPDASVRVLFGQNCFHHFPHPSRFFEELQRVAVPGGGAILLEPYHGPLAAWLFRRLFRTEGYDKNFPSWETPVAGPMNGANQALSYIVFERDRAEFELRFPQLEIVHQETCRNYPMYLLSGGLNFRQLWPTWATPVLKILQRLISPLNRWLALHHIVVIRRKA
ncbi:class I SAM-dependent methyltransferase [Pseudomonas mosselii]|uniref:class I SAM-dependent methyltransferase n=1 Tax=Pseudomonas mosselii TaxID=78327 RepID=UPI0024496141|nr:methyltransferase domain-containing protein [Pseudomonas mosselii]MDH1147170.1 class I SAM-dependent methyltransferase [Pseudomonas mosselii]